jgi:cell division GTPase FtsZ
MTVAFSSQCKMKIKEQTIITDYVMAKIGHEPKALKLGFIQDEDLGDELQITVIAAGFDLKEKSYTQGISIIIDGIPTDNNTEVPLVSDENYITNIQNHTAQFMEQYLIDIPAEIDLDEPAFLRNGVNLLDINKIDKDKIMRFNLN